MKKPEQGPCVCCGCMRPEVEEYPFPSHHAGCELRQEWLSRPNHEVRIAHLEEVNRELLAACEAALDDDGDLDATEAQIRAAIAKAKGGTP